MKTRAFRIAAAVWLSLLWVVPEASASKPHVPLDLAVTHNNQGVGYLAHNDLDRAEIEFKTACELDPLYADAFNNLGLVYKFKGQFALATTALETAIKIKPKWAAPYSHLGAVYLATGDLDKAVKILTKATEIDTKFADAFYNLGIVYLARAKKSSDPKKDWEEAAKALQQATSVNSHLYAAHLDLADTYVLLGQLEKAILRYRLAIETNPKDPEPWRHLGNLYKQTGDETKAKECFDKVKILEPKSEEDLLKTGQDLTSQKRYDEAMAVFQRALQKNPNDAMAYFNIGYLLAAQGRDAEAAGAYQRAIQADPNFLEGYFNLGMTLKKLNNPRGALAAFQQAVRINPAHAESLYEAGGLELQLNNPRGCFAAYCQFLMVAGNRFPQESRQAKDITDRMGSCKPPPSPDQPKSETESGPSRSESPGQAHY
jgi:tetratricopeptide (TPR) repeat protein